MIKASVIGGTGYSGQVLSRLLLEHPMVELVSIGSRSFDGQLMESVYGNFRKETDLVCTNESIEALAEKSDIIFLALPHGIASKQVTKSILEKTKIVDLGADFRLKNVNTYEEWYGVSHYGRDLLNEAIYGLCELNRKDIVDSRLIANPGCYTTCSILSLAPLLKSKAIIPTSIIIDAKSGVSGAGRGMDLSLLFGETNENMRAYKLGTHRHTPEIEEVLSEIAEEQFKLTFTPHIVPMNRGILVTAYAELSENYSWDDIYKIFMNQYGNEKFIRILPHGKLPETRWVKGSNFVDIGFEIDARNKRIIVCGAIDNLMKGAAGQAIQNMNLMFGWEESMGLDFIGDFPI